MYKRNREIEKNDKGSKTFNKGHTGYCKEHYLKINEPFKNLFNINLADALTKVPETGLTTAKTKVQKQKERRESAMRFKNSAEEQ